MATFSPSTAEVTEIAGVIIPSPKNKPRAEDPERHEHGRAGTLRRWTSDGQRHDPAVTAVVARA